MKERNRGTVRDFPNAELGGISLRLANSLVKRQNIITAVFERFVEMPDLLARTLEMNYYTLLQSVSIVSRILEILMHQPIQGGPFVI